MQIADPEHAAAGGRADEHGSQPEASHPYRLSRAIGAAVPDCASPRASLRSIRARGRHDHRRQVPHRVRARRGRDGDRRGRDPPAPRHAGRAQVPARRHGEEQPCRRALHARGAGIGAAAQRPRLPRARRRHRRRHPVHRDGAARRAGYPSTASSRRAARCPRRWPSDIVLQACHALAEAHALGIVHRDLKPGNLFWTQRADGTPIVKVLDFGVAKAPDAVNFSLTQTASVVGSPGLHVARAAQVEQGGRPAQRHLVARRRALRAGVAQAAVQRRVDHRARAAGRDGSDAAAAAGAAAGVRGRDRPLPREGSGAAVPGRRRARAGPRAVAPGRAGSISRARSCGCGAAPARHRWRRSRPRRARRPRCAARAASSRALLPRAAAGSCPRSSARASAPA